MKTIKEWLETLPEPYKEKALEYAALENTLETRQETLHDALHSAFIWKQTVQGFEYWKGLFNGLVTV